MPTEIEKGHCPECGPERFADVVGHHFNRWDDDGSGVWLHTDYRIMKCRGCRHVYFQVDTVFSEDVDHEPNPITGEWEQVVPHKIIHYPAPSKREPPAWSPKIELIDSDLSSLFADVYGALNAELRVPAAIATRTVFDRASELLNVDPAISFSEKLNELVVQRKISDDEQEVLSVLTDAGSAAAHRGWRPKPQELDTMIQIVESFLHRTFVLGEAAKALKSGIPEKQKRRVVRKRTKR